MMADEQDGVDMDKAEDQASKYEKAINGDGASDDDDSD